MKRIAIIGGGISGLTVLHYLKQRLGTGAEITLYERELVVGGTIRSFKKDSCLFEWGPNGFLDNQPATLQLIEELGLTDQLIEAEAVSSRRYVQNEGKLEIVPSNPLDFIQTPLLSFSDKCAVIAGLFKGNVPKDCSIHDYVSRRFSLNIAESLIDPFMNGICAGDIKRLHMAAFPKFKRKGFRKPRMRSFQGGMGQIILALEQRYKNCIKTDCEISSVPEDTDITIIATPAYAAAEIVQNTNPFLAGMLRELPYAPITVAGLLFKKDSFKNAPDGFGYLVPSREKKSVLGVLIESNVFPGRAGENEIMLRMMMGGVHHPAIINDGEQESLVKAVMEVDNAWGLLANPIEGFVRSWPKAIPQYELNYPRWRQDVREECSRTPGLYLCANYLDGISFNDCVNSARTLADLLSYQSVR